MKTRTKIATATLGALVLAASAQALTLLSYDFQTPVPDTSDRDFTPSYTDPGYTGSSLLTRAADGATNWGSDGWSGGTGNTLSWAGSATDPSFTVSFDGVGFTDFAVSFGYINEHSVDLAYSLDYQIGGGGFQSTGISGSLTANNGGSGPGGIVSVDLAPISALNEQAGITLRFDIGALSNTLKIDDLAVFATAAPVPEPSSAAALAGLAMLASAALRRRRATPSA